MNKLGYLFFKFFLYVNAASHALSVTATQISFLIALPYTLIRASRMRRLLSDFPLLLPLGLWIGWVILGSFFIPDQTRILKQIISWWRVLFVVFGYLAIIFGENIRKLCLIVIATSVLQALYGIFQFAVMGLDRASGFFGNPLTFSNGLAMTAVGMMSWSFFNSRASLKERVGLSLAVVVLFIGITLSLSRTVIYGMILLGGILALVKYRLKGLLVMVSAVSVFILITVDKPAFERLYNRGELVTISNSTRAVLWKGAVAMIRDYPLFGIGVHVFPKLIDSYSGGYPLHTKGHAHNAYLQAALNYGIPGCFLILYVYFCLAGFLVRSWGKDRNPWALVGLSVLAMYLIEGLTENNFDDAEVVMFFWFIEGLIIGQVKIENERNLSRKAP